MPCRIASDRSRVTTVPSRVTIQALFEVPSVTKPSSTSQASSLPACFAIILHIDGARSCTVLMSRRPQRMSGTPITRIPSRAAGRVHQRPRLGEDDEARHRLRRIGEVPVRRAPRHLEVDHPLGRRPFRATSSRWTASISASVAGAGMSSSPSERCSRREVAGEVDELPLEHARHLVDPVGEEEAAVEDVIVASSSGT